MLLTVILKGLKQERRSPYERERRGKEKKGG